MERLICLLIGYACGLFQTSYLLGKRANIDIRQHGSGNAGTTNAMRVMGKKAGALTLLGDFLKCIVSVLIVRLLFGRSHSEMVMLLSLYAGTGCILGHNFPFYLNFKGGKGIAASVGLVFILDWRMFLIAAVVFFTVFFTTHYVSASSISAYITAFIVMIVCGQFGCYRIDDQYRMEMYLVMAALTILAIARHRANIVRLLHGNENKIFLKSKKE